MSNIQRARRIPNANGQVLIENWVEERATEHFDHRLEQQNKNQSISPSLSPTTVKKTSHTALLTPNFEAPLGDVTTYRDDYYKFGPFEQIERGARRKRLEQALTRQVNAELKARKREYEENLRQERIDNSTSEYRIQYTKEFESKPPPATQVNILRKKIETDFFNIFHSLNIILLVV
jgi:hypothetical protein